MSNIAIIGGGVMGIMLASAFQSLDHNVYIIETDQVKLKMLNCKGFKAFSSLSESSTPEYIFICVCITNTRTLIKELISSKPSSIIMDITSIKNTVCSDIVAANFVSTHPLFGGNEVIYDSNFAKGKKWILIPSEENTIALEDVKKLLAELNSIVTCTDFETHDWQLAKTSHFPHLLIAKYLEKFCLDSSMEGTGVAKLRAYVEHKALWDEVFVRNKTNLDKLWQEYIAK